MKLKLLFLAGCVAFFGTYCCAQSPVLDSTVAINTGQLATVYVLNNALAIPVGNAGANETYDYAVLPIYNSNYEILGVDNLTSPFGATYPTANATVSWSSFGNPFYHFQLSDTAYTYLGGGGSFSNYELIDTYDQLRFPFSYNDTYSDSFVTVSNTGGYRVGSVTVTAEGYGTLLIPNQTFSDVLRVRRESDYYDTINGNPRHSVETYYEYYKPGIPHYILLHGFYTITSGGSNPVSGAQLFVNTSAVVSRFNSNDLKNTYCIRYTTNESFLNIKNEKAFSTVMLIYNNQGQVVLQDNLSVTNSTTSKALAYPDLATGMYFIQFKNYLGETINLKWNKQQN